MTELLNLLFNPLSNGIMTVLTGISLFYWVCMLFSGGGDTDMDIHFGDVADVDVAHDLDSNTDVHATEPSFWSEMMEYINIGKVPLMVIITLFKFIGWIITLLSSILLDLSGWGVKSVLILIPVFFITYIIMHYITKPLVKMYKNIGYNGEESHDYLGRTGILKSTIENDRIGILEVTINRDVIRLNVISQHGKQLPYGTEVMIIKENKDPKIYEVVQNITIHNI